MAASDYFERVQTRSRSIVEGGLFTFATEPRTVAVFRFAWKVEVLGSFHRLVPGAIAYDPNAKRFTSPTSRASVGAKYKTGEKVKFNSHQYFGSVSISAYQIDRSGAP